MALKAIYIKDSSKATQAYKRVKFKTMKTISIIFLRAIFSKPLKTSLKKPKGNTKAVPTPKI